VPIGRHGGDRRERQQRHQTRTAQLRSCGDIQCAG
jgi:hypothetical protein